MRVDQKRMLHGLVTDRIYHEDNLLSQRTYNFLTFNVFLAAVLTLYFGERASVIPGLGYLLALLGIVLSVLQTALGRRIDIAIAFWRRYLRMIEKSARIPMDHTLFEFYLKGEVETVLGVVRSEDAKPRAMFSALPWKIIPSTNLMVGVLFPWLLSTLWFVVIVMLLFSNHHYYWVSIAVFGYFIVTVFAWCYPLPSYPRLEDESDAG
jgi:hypothetical protein